MDNLDKAQKFIAPVAEILATYSEPEDQANLAPLRGWLDSVMQRLQRLQG